MARGVRVRNAFACGLALLAAALVAASSGIAEPAKTGVDVDLAGGFARLVFNMGEDVDGSVRLAGSVLIVSFTKPIAVSVDRLPAQAPDYIGAARRDPDGKALRLGLARKVTVKAMAADDKFFVDLLPESWSGPPPGLPPEVIQELARRAREAERLERIERRAQQKKQTTVRVRVASQPTFTRYVFDVPDGVAVSADRVKDRLTLSFDMPIKFDLADAAAALPRALAAIKSEVDDESARVHFDFLLKVDVRTFRDGKSYVVDVSGPDDERSEHSDASAAALPGRGLETGPATKPAAEAIGQPPRASPAARLQAAKAAPAATILPPPAPPAAATTPSLPKTKSAAPAKPSPPPRPAALMNAPDGKPAPPAVIGTSAPPQSVTRVEVPVEGPVVAPAISPSAPAVTPAAAAVAGRAANPAANPASVTAPPSRTPRAGKPGEAMAVELTRQGGDLKLSFPFRALTAAAAFQRADTLWIVFDSTVAMDLSAISAGADGAIRSADLTRAPDGDIIRIRLDSPRLSSVASAGSLWTLTIGDHIVDPTRALEIGRSLIGPDRSSVTIPFADPHRLHRISDPQAGDRLFVVTGFAPARGFINPREFVEFRVLASVQGVVIEPIADDLTLELSPDSIAVARPGGLVLSSSPHAASRVSTASLALFDSDAWDVNRQGIYSERQSQLIAAAAAAPPNKRSAPRLDLARFYIARRMYPEAKGVLDLLLGEDRAAARNGAATVLRAMAEIMMNRPDEALKDLADPAVGNQHNAPIWRAVAYARAGKWTEAREDFKTAGAAITTLPIELQRIVLKEELRAAIAAGDFAAGTHQLSDLGTIGVPREMQPAIAVLRGKLYEGIGRNDDALAAYRAAADSWDRPAAAQGRLRETALRYKLGKLKRDEVVAALETLTTVWRGDETEIGALEILARLYTEERRYRDSFYVMRSALAARPDSDMTRRIQDAAAATFEALFLGAKGDALPAVDALALFYDFRELTPIGRRGDEMIRRLADRLVSVDLLDQAADLLQYQVDHRLQGAARAQVAMRLAIIYLMNHKADRALATLRVTRTADVADDLRNQRLLLEGRSLSDLGRHDLALEVIANVQGPEAIRLRSDILWAARRWRESAEQIELMYGTRWKDWQPLNELEQSDVLRAAIGYALGEDKLGLGRFREKYAAKMAQTPDRHDFEVVTGSLGISGSEFRDIARAAASVDTLDRFLRDLQGHYPESRGMPEPGSASPASSAPAAALAPPQTKRPPGSVSLPSAQARTAQLSQAQ